MKRIVLMLLVLPCLSMAIAQKKTKISPAVVKPSVASSAPAGLFIGQRQGPRTYRDVITEKAVTQKGLFTIHKVEDKYFFEVHDSIMNREIMTVTRFIKVPASKGLGRGAYGGELTNQQTVAFEKGPSNNVFMRVITLVNVADTSNAIYKAVTNSNLNAIAAAFPIAAYTDDST